jgi:hypothetical protein
MGKVYIRKYKKFEDLGVDGRIILKLVLNIYVSRVWNCFNIGISDGSL